jgi:hypothetical protein
VSAAIGFLDCIRAWNLGFQPSEMLSNSAVSKLGGRDGGLQIQFLYRKNQLMGGITGKSLALAPLVIAWSLCGAAQTTEVIAS